MILCSTFLLSSSIGIATAASVPFAHADWKASPTDPVGFAGQGNNWFPGATPPLIWSHAADGKGQNIRWKVPIPGWTDAQPLVVGKRIVWVYSPHYVVCFDADTGKVLWQDELKLMTLPDRGEVGQPGGAVPEAAKAAKMQLLFERGLAWSRLSAMVTLGKDKKMDSANMATRLPLIRHAHETMAGWETAMTVDFPQEAAALQESLAGIKMYLNGDWEAVHLTVPGFTPDISAKHFPKAAELYPTADMIVGHCNYQGIGFNFAVDTSGLTAIGSRIYLHSPGMLICIGEK